MVRIKQEGLLCKLHVLQERTRELFINNSDLIPESEVPTFVDEEYYAPNTAVNKVDLIKKSLKIKDTPTKSLLD